MTWYSGKHVWLVSFDGGNSS